jgi:hypothetical protein
VTDAELAEVLRRAAPRVDDYAAFDAVLARADELDPPVVAYPNPRED